MKHLNLDVYEPGDLLGTISSDGKVAIWTVGRDGGLAPSDNRILKTGFSADDPIDLLELTVRTYNVLKREGIHTIGDLIQKWDAPDGREWFAGLRNLGDKGLEEIEAKTQELTP